MGEGEADGRRLFNMSAEERPSRKGQEVHKYSDMRGALGLVTAHALCGVVVHVGPPLFTSHIGIAPMLLQMMMMTELYTYVELELHFHILNVGQRPRFRR